MAKIHIRKPYTMPREDIRETVKGLAEKLERDHGIRASWKGDTVRIADSGVEGRLSFEDGVIDVSVKLGLITSIFAPRLKKAVSRYLDKHVT